MSSKVSKSRKEAAVAPVQGIAWWWYALGGLAALVLVFEIYGPAIRAPFLFDDRYLPFLVPGFAEHSLRDWMAGVRPALMLSYWMNYQASQTDPYSYHVVNVLFHLGNSIFVWLSTRRILEWAGVSGALRTLLALFGGLLFLFHPIQTESVTYVASRSENQSLFFFLAAFVLFLYRRRRAVSIPVTAGILALFGAAVLTKEHTAVLPALLLLTDYYWNPGFSFQGIRGNWKLYVPMGAGGALAMAFVFRVLSTAKTAGFGMKDMTWYDYFFTQCRAIWVYLRMFVLPYGLNVDHDFAVSRSIMDGGAVIGMIALAALAVAAWIWRRQYPLASYGYFAFLLLMAPTSSFVPIADVLVDRRVYLAFLPLILISCEFLRRASLNRAALATALALLVFLFAGVTYARNQVWGDPVALWTDTVEKSPNKSRPHFQLAYAYYSLGRCADAAREYDRVAQLEKPDYSLYIDWGLAEECAHHPQQALDKFRLASALEKSAHVYSLMGMVYIKQNDRTQALAALDQAEKLDPNFQMTYTYRGNLLLLAGEFDQSAEQYQKALALNPADADARNGLDLARRRVIPQVK